jgi:hypothetical protein
MKFVFALALFMALPLSAALPVQSQTPAIQTSWEPAESDVLKVKMLSYLYFQAKSNRDFQTAFNTFAKATAAGMNFKEWKSTQEKFYNSAGAELDRSFYRMTWYQNPPDAELPGIFVAVDFSAKFTQIGTQCGTLMWHRLDTGGFELIRDQVHTLGKTAQKSIKTQSGCKEP